MQKSGNLIGIKLKVPGEKFTKQVKISMPKNYIREISFIASIMRVPKRYVVWDAVGNYIQGCRQAAKTMK